MSPIGSRCIQLPRGSCAASGCSINGVDIMAISTLCFSNIHIGASFYFCAQTFDLAIVYSICIICTWCYINNLTATHVDWTICDIDGISTNFHFWTSCRIRNGCNTCQITFHINFEGLNAIYITARCFSVFTIFHVDNGFSKIFNLCFAVISDVRKILISNASNNCFVTSNILTITIDIGHSYIAISIDCIGSWFNVAFFSSYSLQLRYIDCIIIIDTIRYISNCLITSIDASFGNGWATSNSQAVINNFSITNCQGAIFCQINILVQGVDVFLVATSRRITNTLFNIKVFASYKGNSITWFYDSRYWVTRMSTTIFTACSSIPTRVVDSLYYILSCCYTIIGRFFCLTSVIRCNRTTLGKLYFNPIIISRSGDKTFTFNIQGAVF